MSLHDGRDTLVLDGVAALALEGRLRARRYAPTEPMQACRPVLALRRDPLAASEQLDQLLFGERFEVLDQRDGWAFGRACRDGYVGWVALEGLGPLGAAPTHWVSALRTYAFSEPSIKSAPIALLSMNALVQVDGGEGRFLRLAGAGFVVRHHLSGVGAWREDAAAVAEAYVGAPYLWGGRDSLGLDCSGLVQQALYACGRGAPRDSDQQATLGFAVEPLDGLQRCDLVFWRGHVGMMLDAGRLIHANAHHMAVTIEPLAEAIARIAAAGGQPTGYRRPAP